MVIRATTYNGSKGSSVHGVSVLGGREERERERERERREGGR